MDLAEMISDIGVGRGLTTLVVSMLPVVELRGAIPIGVGLGLPLWQAALISMLGNIIPAPFIIAFVRTVMDWLRERSVRAQRFVYWLLSMRPRAS